MRTVLYSVFIWASFLVQAQNDKAPFQCKYNRKEVDVISGDTIVEIKGGGTGTDWNFLLSRQGSDYRLQGFGLWMYSNPLRITADNEVIIVLEDTTRIRLSPDNFYSADASANVTSILVKYRISADQIHELLRKPIWKLRVQWEGGNQDITLKEKDQLTWVEMAYCMLSAFLE